MFKKRFLQVIIFIFTFFIASSLLVNAAPAEPDDPFDSGSGANEDPFLISTCDQLQAINDYSSSHFALDGDIDCSGTNEWNENAENPGFYYGFDPIENFSGSLDGRGYSINNLYINRPSEEQVALFAYVLGGEVEFKDLSFGNSENDIGKADITGGMFVGALVALSADAVSFNNISVYADVSAENLETPSTPMTGVGGIVGIIDNGSMVNSSFVGDINHSGNYDGGVGGLAGVYAGSVIDSNFTGTITSSGTNVFLGGLIGMNPDGVLDSVSGTYYEINNSHVEADILAEGDNVGGLAGVYAGSVIDSSFTGTITSNSGGVVGGLIGMNPDDTINPVSGTYYEISNSYVEADILAEGDNVGGLAGVYAGSVIDSSFTGTITSNSGGVVGGLIGMNPDDTINPVSGTYYEISNSYVEADILAEGDNVGGLAGVYAGSVIDSSFTGTITSNSGGVVGGLIGAISSGLSGGGDDEASVKSVSLNDPTAPGDEEPGDGSSGDDTYYEINNSHVEADILVEGDYTGGLIGAYVGSVINSSFVGAIISNNGMIVSGIGNGASVSNSYASGEVTGVGVVSGLSNEGDIDNSYSEMDVKITFNSEKGGFDAAGLSAVLEDTTSTAHKITNSYFSGTIEDISENKNNTLYGINGQGASFPASNSFWLNGSGTDIGAPNGEDSDIYQVSESELKTLSTFTGDRIDAWNIATINNHSDETWYINEGYDYPKLFWEDKEFYLEYDVAENGSISGPVSQVVVEGGSAQKVEVVPDSGYKFDSWSDGLNSDSRTDANVNSNISVIANFKKKASGSTFRPSVCRSVEYGPWKEVVSGFDVQYRDIVSKSPSSCYLTRNQIEKVSRRVGVSEDENEGDANEEDDDKQKSESDVSVGDVMARERNMVKNINRELSDRLSGRILLQVEEGGQAWYLDPVKKQKHFMGRPSDAFQLMRDFGLGISEDDYKKFSEEGVADKYAGQILFRAEKNGEAYYINPDTLEMHYLSRPADAFKIMRDLALGIDNEKIRQIKVGK